MNRELDTGQQVAGFTIQRVLSISELSVTYIAAHKDQNLVVLKELNPKSFVKRNELGQLIPISESEAQPFTRINEHFFAVGSVLCELDNRSIAKVETVISANNTSYLVMKYEEGFSLKDVLEQTPVLEYEDIKSIIFPVLDGLKILHSKKTLHLSINPENLLIRKDGTPVLLGLSSLYECAFADGISLAALNPGYAPIEQFSSDKKLTSPCSDIYSLAAVLYQMMSGHIPAKSNERYQSMNELGVDPYESILDATKGKFAVKMLNAVDHALALKPGDRPASVVGWTQEFLALTVTGDVTVAKDIKTLEQETEQAETKIESKPMSSMEEMLEDRRKLFRAYLGGKKQSYYMAKLIRQDERGLIPRLSWNTAAFVFNMIWFFYRKMYFFGFVGLPVIALGFTLTIAFLVEKQIVPIEKYYFVSPSADISFVSYLLFYLVLSGIFGNYFYYLHIRWKILRSSKKFPDLKSQRKRLSKKGGTSKVAALLVTIVILADSYGLYSALTEYKNITDEQIREAISALEFSSKKVAEFKREYGRWPKNTYEIKDFPNFDDYEYIDQVDVLNKLLVATFKKTGVAPTLANKSLAFVAYESEGEILWTCGAINVPLRFLPSSCKKNFKK